jgi:DNA-binding NarL/FixJ family response regulator
MSTNIIRVLLVDDHPVVREGLRGMLRDVPGIQVVAEAGDGLEAVQAAASHHPDVVLMDIRMPNMDGLEATRLIKRKFPHITVVILTMFDSDAMIMEALRAGAGGYLLKDASQELLVHTIRAAHSGGTLIETSLLQSAVRELTHPIRAAEHEGPVPEAQVGELTAQERRVLRSLAGGSTNGEIASALHIGEDCVRGLITKLGVSDRTQAALKAARLGLMR